MYNPNWTIGSELASTGMPRVSWLSNPVATWAYQLPGTFLALKHPALLAAIFLLFSLGLLSSARLLSSSRRHLVLVLLWFLLPPLVLLVVQVRFFDRYLSYFLPLLAVVVAHGPDCLAATIAPRQPWRWAATALLAVEVVTPNLVQLPDYYEEIQKGHGGR